LRGEEKGDFCWVLFLLSIRVIFFVLLCWSSSNNTYIDFIMLSVVNSLSFNFWYPLVTLVLSLRVILKGDKYIPQVLVHWEGIDPEHVPWEEFTYMQQAYPNFNLEDNVDFDGRGNVTSGNSTNTKTVKEMGREKNNEEVSSDAMIVGKRNNAGRPIHSGLCVIISEEYY